MFPLLVAALLSAPSEPLPLWRWEQPKPAEIAALATAVALIWVDVGLSRDGALRPRNTWVEHDWTGLLGEHPSQGRYFWVGGVLSTAVLTATWYALPTGWRLLPCGGVIGGEGYAVASMLADGFRIRF